ncbi:MAG: PIG-L family deacetylase [Flavobacterium sp.]
MQKLHFFILLFFLLFKTGWAQRPLQPNAAEIYHQIQKLNFLGSVLYVAAHPDDENTRLISYFSNYTNARTGYLSLTRGDGGQNLIGPEMRELLGVIRTQELIEARKIDGGEQFFTRANDFGFSKNPEETFQIWDKNEILSDVVWTIRKFQPDIIINRFDHRTPGTTHGHHTASALLSVEAFDKAMDDTAFPSQLKYVSVWKPKRLFFNPSWFFFGSKEKFEKADKSGYSQLQIGTFYPSSGKSNQEIAALSRSKHQSQGFGSTGARGEEYEYLELLKGESLKEKNAVFEGIDTSWNRLEGGEAIGKILYQAEQDFDFKNPSSIVPDLIKAYELIQKLKDNHWKTIKSEELKNIIAACTGLYLEAVSDKQEITPESLMNVKWEAINRSTVPIKLNGLLTNPESTIDFKPVDLKSNISNTSNFEMKIPEDFEYTNAYWLNEANENGMYCVNDQQKTGLPDIIRKIAVTFNIEINGVNIPFTRNIVYKYNDDVKGEVYQPLDVVPLVTAAIAEKVYTFNNNDDRGINVEVIAGKDNIKGSIKLEVPYNWKVSPNEIPFSIEKKGQDFSAVFKVAPSEEISESLIKAKVTIDSQTYDKDKTDINYPHIYKQMVLKPATAKAIHFKIKTKNERIAYIKGAGDEMPKCLQQMGYFVEIINPEQISTKKLMGFDVIITGIRAYNVVNALAFKQDILLDLVKKGKTMIVQYNTLDDLVTKKIAPYPIKISRDRVTEEQAEVRFLNPKHKVMNYPNKITTEDFKGWKQEQGLYYPNEWDANFTPILSANDKGESPKNGALLVAKYGKGHYIYTGLSFFRELPEGVPGAYRLLANMIAIGN